METGAIAASRKTESSNRESNPKKPVKTNSQKMTNED